MINKKITEIFLSEENKELPEYIQVIRIGKFKDYWTGDFEVSKQMLKEMYNNYNDKARGIDLAVDIAHMNQLEAAGWFKELQLRNNDEELWAKIDWTELGIEKISKKLFRYISAEFDTQYRDNESGKVWGCCLLGAALTNRPFVKGMSPTTNLAEEKVMEEKVKKLEESNVKLSEEIKVLNETIKSLSDEKVSLEEKNKELESKIELSKKEVEFDKMLSEGKAVPAQKEAWIKGDLVEFAEKASSIKVNLQEKGSGENKEEDSKKDEDALIEASKKLAEEKNITFAEATSLLLNNPEFIHLNK